MQDSSCITENKNSTDHRDGPADGSGLALPLVLLFVRLSLGALYSFRGPDINTSLNDMMGKAQEKAAVAVEAQVEELLHSQIAQFSRDIERKYL